VESPGTAPGSEPRITGAFIAIVRVAPHTTHIRCGADCRKGAVGPQTNGLEKRIGDTDHAAFQMCRRGAKKMIERVGIKIEKYEMDSP
jgi:hypothetical protein